MPIDAHLLAWAPGTDTDRAEMRWMPETVRAAHPAASLATVDGDLADCGVRGVVLAQVANTLAHTQDLLTVAASARMPARVTGWVPLDDPDETRRALDSLEHGELLAGVRHRLLRNEGDEMMLSEPVRRSLDVVAAAGLSIEIIPTSQDTLLTIPPLARSHRGLKIVINMLGWPEVLHREMQPWTDYFTAAGACPSVYVKICSTHFMDGEMSVVSDFKPYLTAALEIFGADRMMIGSNWPVLTAAFPRYRDAMAAVGDAFGSLTPGERHAVEEATAADFYGLPIG